eukprot:TRINITY_DN811_c0_g8_i4.p1 TRINITY_DN811_c0_g8~~TRINITY_DN811_c0_g8_i4.p1  ORF type:complete len:343 (-),score=59.33 TRINITY_DN811_c0_g8_i4:64-1092(-)
MADVASVNVDGKNDTTQDNDPQSVVPDDGQKNAQDEELVVVDDEDEEEDDLLAPAIGGDLPDGDSGGSTPGNQQPHRGGVGASHPKPFGSDPCDTSAPPATGEEYLRRVKYEARHLCPSVVVAKNIVKSTRDDDARHTNHYLQQFLAPTFPNTPDALLPHSEWRLAFISSFSELRQRFARSMPSVRKQHQGEERVRLPGPRDSSGWRVFCFGNASEGGHDPTPFILASMSELTTKTVLQGMVKWMCAEEKKASKGTSKFPEEVVWRWMFALLTRLEKPLDSETAASLRDFARYCSNLRVVLSVGFGFGGDGSSGCYDDVPKLSVLNVMITIVMGYFKQGDER